MYNPVADITNSMSTILKASLSFFNDIDNDEIFSEFGKHCAEFINKARTGKANWHEEALPMLQDMCKKFNNSDNSSRFFVKFFMCVLDFYWHCSRLAPLDPNKDKQIIKALDISSVARTMPKDMREQYIEHLECHGMLPDVMEK
jgi:hypothetical protein